MTFERTALPGIGSIHVLTTGTHRRMAVIRHRGGRRDLVVYDSRDGERIAAAVTLDSGEAVAVAELLRTTVTIDHID